MDVAQLKRLVKQGEGENLEFKKKANFPEKLAREMVAFANSKDSILLLGVDDDGTISGTKTPEEDIYIVQKYIRKHIHYAIPYQIERIALGLKREVVVFHIRQGRRKPYFLLDPSQRHKKTAFIRIKDQSITASPMMVTLLYEQKNKQGTQIILGKHENKIIRFLDNQAQTTLKEIQELLDLPEKEASDLLIPLLKAHILQIHPTDKEDLIAINPQAFE